MFLYIYVRPQSNYLCSNKYMFFLRCFFCVKLLYFISKAKEEETVIEQIEMEKRDIERAKIKLAEMEAAAERKRIEDEKQLLADIEAGAGETLDL
mgnify:CR=1 FL=1